MTAGMDKVLLVQFVGNKGPGTGPWSFPRGKLERKDHDDIFACAVREVRSNCAACADSVLVLLQRYTIRPCSHSQVFEATGHVMQPTDTAPLAARRLLTTRFATCDV